MALDRVAYFIGTPGVKHSAEVVRQALHDSTGGSEGVSSPTALQVLPQNVPNGTVRVISGGGLLLNRYAGGSGQTYAARNASQTTVNISATGSGSGRTDLIVLRVLDPQYEGQAPADPNNFDYTRLEVIQGVPAGTKTFAELGRNYPAIELAKVTLPKSTGTVTSAMITDLRKVAQPKQDIFQMARPNVTGDAGMLLTSRSAYPDGEWFPNVGGQNNNGAYYVDVPPWAVRMIIRMEWLSVRYSGNPGNGWYWVTYGPDAGTPKPDNSTQAFAWDSDDSSATYRTNWILEQEVSVPKAWRGTTIPFVGRARRERTGGSVGLAATSGMTFKVTFKEVADPNNADV